MSGRHNWFFLPYRIYSLNAKSNLDTCGHLLQDMSRLVRGTDQTSTTWETAHALARTAIFELKGNIKDCKVLIKFEYG